MKPAFLLAFLSVNLILAAEPGVRAKKGGRYIATAYSVSGITASGDWTHRHVVAADPDMLPIGSRIQVKNAGKYSGEYVVADTGSKIQGRRLDIYMPSEPECKKFGVKPVRVKVIELGAGTKQAVKQADNTVKTDVEKDVAQGKVGSAATEIDWKTKGAPVAEAAKAKADATPVPPVPATSNTQTPAVPATINPPH